MNDDEEFTIDCLAMKDRIQQEIYEGIKDLTPQQQIEWFRKQVENGPFAELWRRMKAAQPPRTSPSS